MFQLAPGGPASTVALFNPARVRPGDDDRAQFTIGAESGPPDNPATLQEHMTALMKKMGATAPPLPDGR
jgi:hypothetical protein